MLSLIPPGQPMIGFSDIGHRHLFTWEDGSDVVYTDLEGFTSYGKCYWYRVLTYATVQRIL